MTRITSSMFNNSLASLASVLVLIVACASFASAATVDLRPRYQGCRQCKQPNGQPCNVRGPSVRLNHYNDSNSHGWAGNYYDTATPQPAAFNAYAGSSGNAASADIDFTLSNVGSPSTAVHENQKKLYLITLRDRNGKSDSRTFYLNGFDTCEVSLPGAAVRNGGGSLNIVVGNQ